MGKILLISNGHGEDLNASVIAEALLHLYPHIQLSAMPLVGEGNAYRRLGIPIVCPTRTLPSGGFIYMDWRQLGRDLQQGLVGLTWQQLRVITQIRYSRAVDLVLAVGDLLPLLFAYWSQIPFVSYLVSTSAHYENKLILPLTARLLLKSSRCRRIFTRDHYTAQLMLAQGFSQTNYSGYPIMDILQGGGKDLHLTEGQAVICLLPGSRIPEAISNLILLLRLVVCAFALHPDWQFRSAIVPSMRGKNLRTAAETAGWGYVEMADHEMLLHKETGARVLCYDDAFADILLRADVVVGMAGTAMEQAVGLGKPVVQLVGEGPQFTYRFAEAQQRLLGESVQTCLTVEQALPAMAKALFALDYRQGCVASGQERVGGAGGAEQMARAIAQMLGN